MHPILSTMSPPLGCAFDANSKLKNASEIVFYDSESDKTPLTMNIAKGNSLGGKYYTFVQLCVDHSKALDFVDGPTHGRRNKGQRMRGLVAADQLDEFGNLDKKHRQLRDRPAHKRTKVRTEPSNEETFSSDINDGDYSGASSDGSVASDGGRDLEDGRISNGEVR